MFFANGITYALGNQRAVHDFLQEYIFITDKLTGNYF